MDNEIFQIIRVLIWLFVGFGLAMAITPALTHFLYKYRVWRTKVRDRTPDGRPTPVFSELHAHKDVGTPIMGGLLIWVTVVILSSLAFLLAKLNGVFENYNFISRSETWLPLFTLLSAGVIGLVDDYLTVKGKGKYLGGGLSFRWRVAMVLAIGLVGAWWFVSKLGFHTVFIPFWGNLDIGLLFAPFFILVLLGTFSSGVVDGLDGLSAGVFGTIFGAFAAIAFTRGQYDLAVFCAVLLGALFAYLWFNIPPARFYMGETGILGLITTITVVAFLTNAALILPVIGIILVLESASVMLQLLSKKLRNGKKIFLAAPIHHHFEAKGWPAYKVTMRFWVISAVFAILGFLLFLAGPR